MAELFRLRVASGKVLIPSRLLTRLQLREGDELRIMIGDDNSLSLTVAHDVKREEPTPAEAEDLEARRKTIVSTGTFKTMINKLFYKNAAKVKSASSS